MSSDFRGLNEFQAHDLVAGIQPEVKLTKFNLLAGSESHQLNENNRAALQTHQPIVSYRTGNSQSVCNLAANNSNSPSTCKRKNHHQHKYTTTTMNTSCESVVEMSVDGNGNRQVELTSPSPWTTVTSLDQSIATISDQQMGQTIGCLNVSTLRRNVNSFSSQQQIDDLGEPFQVVWRKLSFEVDQSSYDQLIGQSLKKLRSFWPPNIFRKSNGYNENGDVASNDFKREKEISNKRNNNNRKRMIFKNLNGYINSGEITAILGPSGAGKTSLLNAICGQTANYKGSVQLRGGGNRRMRMSIIPQKDYLMENLTVRENLLYSSRILNSDKSFNHDANIMRVVRMLNLTTCFNSSAGSISGGEYKRVSIAQELLRQPDILILDEPTSGLDSMNCKNLIRSLNELIEASRLGRIKPIAIVMTIHQPDVDIFQMFHHIYCMARGGRVIFDGEPSETLNILRSHAGFSDELMPPELSGNNSILGTNPANLLIEIASELIYGQAPIDNLANFQRKQFEVLVDSIEAYNNNYLSTSGPAAASQKSEKSSAYLLTNFVGSRTQLQVDGWSPGATLSPNNYQQQVVQGPGNRSGLDISPASANSLVHDKRLMAKVDHEGQFWHHTFILAKRSFVATIRDPLMVVVSVLFHLSIPFGMWLVYSKKIGSVSACPILQRQMDIVSLISNETLAKVEELQLDVAMAYECSTMYFLTTYSFSMCSLSVAALAFPLNMHILLKEVRNGWYKLPSFVLAKSVASFPFEVLFPIISIIMIYLMLGMPTSYLEWRMCAIALVMGLIAMISNTHGLIYGALFMDSVQSAIFLASASSLPLTLLSGFTARIQHMPIVLQKLSFLSMYRYSSDLVNIIRFGYDTCPCDESTDEYLRSNKPELLGIPSQVKNVMSYYIVNSAASVDDSNSLATTTEPLNTSNETITMMSSNQTNQELVGQAIFGKSSNQITGVSDELMLNATARDKVLKQLESESLDLPGQMASLMSKSFTYGRNIEDCSSVRSQILTTSGTPDDKYLAHLFGGLVFLLVAYKVILFIAVKYRIGGRT